MEKRGWGGRGDWLGCEGGVVLGRYSLVERGLQHRYYKILRTTKGSPSLIQASQPFLRG